MTPEREKEIRAWAKHDCGSQHPVTDLLNEIDRLRASLTQAHLEIAEMDGERVLLKEKLAVAEKGLEKVQFHSLITPDTGPLISWAREALSKIRSNT